MKRMISLALLFFWAAALLWLVACASEETPSASETTVELSTDDETLPETGTTSETDPTYPDNTETETAPVMESDADTQTNSESVTEPETNEENPMPVEPINIQDRYFIFRIWNFTVL